MDEKKIPDETPARCRTCALLSLGGMTGSLLISVFYSVVAIDAAVSRDAWSALAYFLASALWLGVARLFWDKGVRRG